MVWFNCADTQTSRSLDAAEGPRCSLFTTDRISLRPDYAREPGHHPKNTDVAAAAHRGVAGPGPIG
jgi:hypothetical protein